MDCIQCGKELTGRQRKFCSDKCCTDYGNMLKAKARADSLGLPVGHKQCSVCGTVFEYEHNGNKFCSTKCRLTRNQERRTYVQSETYKGRERAKRYGLTEEALKALEEAAGYQCQICGVHEKDAPKARLHVDHDHKTGKVRGLLCQQCNHGLGMFKDDVSMLSKAVEYLQAKDLSQSRSLGVIK